MIIPDTNILIHAYNSHSTLFSQARDFWRATLRGSEEIGLPWVVILGFLRIATNQHVFPNALALETALRMVTEWLALDHVLALTPGPGFAEKFSELVLQNHLTGNQTTDAFIMALALEHEGTIYTTDKLFFRIPQVTCINPLKP